MYRKWADDGVVSSTKSRLVVLGKETEASQDRATDNLRKLPEAIFKLFERGLIRPADRSLMRKVFSKFGGLTTISQQSLAFHDLPPKSAAKAETRGKTGKTFLDFKQTFGGAIERALNPEVARWEPAM